MGIMTLVIVLIIIAIVWGAFWVIDNVNVPYPIGMILKLIVGLVALLKFLAMLGVPIF